MNKKFTLIAGFVLVGISSIAQLNLQTAQEKMSTIEFPTEVDSKTPTNNLKADGDIIWQDDFSGTHVWDIATSGQGTFVIGTNASFGAGSTYLGNMASTTAANGFAFFNGVQYLLAPPIDAQNTSITSEVIDFTGIQTITITFQQRYRAFNSDVTYVEFSADGGTTWVLSEVVNATLITNAPAVQNTINLDIPVDGTATGKIRFRWENPTDDDQYGSGYGWMVDDVVITEGYGNNVTILHTHSSVGVQELQYSKIPLSQSTNAGNISFGAEMKNVGYNTLPVALNVTSGVYDFTGAPLDVASFALDSLSILTADGTAIPAAAGISNFTFEIVSDSTLALTADDSRVVNFEVTQNIYAVDSYDGTAASMTGQFTGWATPNGDPGIGTLFEIFENGEIGSIDIGIANIPTASQATYLGREFFGAIYQYDDVTGDFVYLNETPTAILKTADFGKIVKMKMATSTISVIPGLYLAVAKCYSGQEVPFGTAGFSVAGSTIGFDGPDVVSLASDAATPTIVRAPVVRLDFQSYVGTEEMENVSGVTLAPNPFTNSTEINFNLNQNDEVTVTVTDLAGKNVLTIPAATFEAGTHSISIAGNTLNNGVYNCTIKVGNNEVIKRIVKM
jgi:hypothetical protein